MESNTRARLLSRPIINFNVVFSRAWTNQASRPLAAECGSFSARWLGAGFWPPRAGKRRLSLIRLRFQLLHWAICFWSPPLAARVASLEARILEANANWAAGSKVRGPAHRQRSPSSQHRFRPLICATRGTLAGARRWKARARRPIQICSKAPRTAGCRLANRQSIGVYMAAEAPERERVG